jgi:hypothetical protein
MAWYENTNGLGRYGQRQLIAVRQFPLLTADIDGDGDADVISRSRDEKIWWYENVSLQPGDANRDGEFNQVDIVQALQPAKYLTGELASWSTGDWNGDGVFDQADIVAALATGNYMQGPYVDAALA